MFLRKSYRRVAGVINAEIRKQQGLGNAGAVQSLYDIAYAFAVEFAKDNPAFDEWDFLHACGAADQ